MTRRFFASLWSSSSSSSPTAATASVSADASLTASTQPSGSGWISPMLAFNNWWTNSDQEALIRSQNALLSAFVSKPFHNTSYTGLNSVEFTNDSTHGGDTHVILTHGFGSGLGLFGPRVVDLLLENPSVRKVSLVDWYGMAGSERQGLRPIRRRWQLDDHSKKSAFCICDAGMTPKQAIDFFLDPFHRWMQHQQEQNDPSVKKTILVGHSLGGYLSAQYVWRYCSGPSPPVHIDQVVLASPVGFPRRPENVLQGAQLPTSLRILDALWSRNMTPQQIVRLMGATRGRRTVQRVLEGRIPHLMEDPKVDLIADYLYHITVAPPSGEFAMNSLLAPAVSTEVMGVFARESLTDMIISSSSSSEVPKLTFSKLLVLYGDHDWMRPNEPSARLAMDYLRKRGSVSTDVAILPSAGHHLYLDNSEAFVAKVLE